MKNRAKKNENATRCSLPNVGDRIRLANHAGRPVDATVTAVGVDSGEAFGVDAPIAFYVANLEA